MQLEVFPRNKPSSLNITINTALQTCTFPDYAKLFKKQESHYEVAIAFKFVSSK